MTPQFQLFLRLTLPAIPLFLLSYEDLRVHRLSLAGILLLQGFGLGYAALAGSFSLPAVALWFLLLLGGFLVGRLESPGLGEGDFYVLSALSLFHTPGELLLISCLAVWLLFPCSLGCFLKQRRVARESSAVRDPPGAAAAAADSAHEKGASLTELPLIPALFAARQLVGLAVRLL